MGGKLQREARRDIYIEGEVAVEVVY